MMFALLRLGVVCHTAIGNTGGKTKLLAWKPSTYSEILISIKTGYEEVVNSMNHTVKKAKPGQCMSPDGIWRERPFPIKTDCPQKYRNMVSLWTVSFIWYLKGIPSPRKGQDR